VTLPATWDRPREKLLRAGAAALGDNELVAIVLGTGVKDRDALALAQDVLEAASGVHALSTVDVHALSRLPGVGLARATRLLAAVELGRRVISGRRAERPRLATPADTARYLLPRYSGQREERFGVVMLDTKNRLIRLEMVSIGTLDRSIAHPREVFRPATLASAARVVLFHNHPSGDPAPSPDDVQLTRRLAAAGTILGITVADHVILGEGRYFSFREAGVL
jgi:DNA repair protein RadC